MRVEIDIPQDRLNEFIKLQQQQEFVLYIVAASGHGDEYKTLLTEVKLA